MINNLKINEYAIFKYLWIIVIFPKPVQLIILALIMIKLFNKSNKNIDLTTMFILVHVVVYIISIYINIHSTNYTVDRMLAAINTMGIWLIGILMYVYYKNNKIDIEKLSKYSYINIIILIVLSVLSFLLYNIVGINRLSVMGASLYSVDWFQGEAQLRFIGLLDYSNLVVLFYMMFFPFGINYILNYRKGNRKSIYIVASFIPIILTLSRSGYVVVLLSSILGLIYLMIRKMNINKIAMVIIIAMSVSIFLIYYYDLINIIPEKINELINGRPGSTSTRKYLYEESIRLTTMHSPIWGLAIKQMSIMGYPLGSHSTYIGLYYKTGIIGAMMAIMGLFTANINILRSKIKTEQYRLICIYIVMLLLMFIFEDIDGSNWSIVCYLSIIAVMLNKENWNSLEKNIKK